MIALGISADRIALIPGSGVDVQTFAAPCRSRRALPPWRSSAGCSMTRAFDTLIAAHRLLRQRGSNVELLIAGTPDPANPASVGPGRGRRLEPRAGHHLARPGYRHRRVVGARPYRGAAVAPRRPAEEPAGGRGLRPADDRRRRAGLPRGGASRRNRPAGAGRSMRRPWPTAIEQLAGSRGLARALWRGGAAARGRAVFRRRDRPPDGRSLPRPGQIRRAGLNRARDRSDVRMMNSAGIGLIVAVAAVISAAWSSCCCRGCGAMRWRTPTRARRTAYRRRKAAASPSSPRPCWLPPCAVVLGVRDPAVDQRFAWAVAAATLFIALVGAIDDLRTIEVAPRLLLQALAVAIVIASLPAACGSSSIAAVVDRARAAADRVPVVRQSHQFHGRHRLDDRRRIRADHARPGADRVARRVAGRTASSSRSRLCGGLLGFAPFNRPVARVFLGDVGSLPIGLLCAWLLVLARGPRPSRRGTHPAALLSRRRDAHTAAAGHQPRAVLAGAPQPFLSARDRPRLEGACRSSPACSRSISLSLRWPLPACSGRRRRSPRSRLRLQPRWSAGCCVPSREASHDAASSSPAPPASSAARSSTTWRQPGISVRAAMRQPADVFARSVEVVAVSDLTRPVEWRALLKGVETVVHLAGIAHAGPGIAEDAYDRVNRLATAELAKTAHAVGIRHLVFVSSIRAQSGPTAANMAARDRCAAADRCLWPLQARRRRGGARLERAAHDLAAGADLRSRRQGQSRAAHATCAKRPGRCRSGYAATAVRCWRGSNLIAAIHLALGSPAARNETYIVADPTPLTLADIVDCAARRRRALPGAVAGAATAVGACHESGGT